MNFAWQAAKLSISNIIIPIVQIFKAQVRYLNILPNEGYGVAQVHRTYNLRSKFIAK